MCQVQDITQTMDLRRARWIEKLSCMDFTRCPMETVGLAGLLAMVGGRVDDVLQPPGCMWCHRRARTVHFALQLLS